MRNEWRTQRITAVDLANGRIRIPAGEKEPFPQVKDRLTIRFLGERLDDIAWDPRCGPDRDRSGVLRINRRLRELVGIDEVMVVRVIDGVVDIRRE